MKEFFLHIGYPKTGTTFLQRKVFNEDSELKYLGKSQSLENSSEIDIIVDELRLIPNKTFKSNQEKYIERIKSIIDFETTTDKFVYSNELLLNQLFCPHFCITVLLNRLLTILKTANLKVKLIATHRDISDLILALFSEAPHHFSNYHGKWNSFYKFKRSLFSDIYDKRTSNFINSLNLEYIKKNIDLSEEDFCILAFSQLKNDFESYHAQLQDFIGTTYQKQLKHEPQRVNPSTVKDGVYESKKYQMILTEFIARIIPRSVKNLLPHKVIFFLKASRNRTEKFFTTNRYMLSLANLLERLFLRDKVEQITFTETEKSALKQKFKLEKI